MDEGQTIHHIERRHKFRQRNYVIFLLIPSLVFFFALLFFAKYLTGNNKSASTVNFDGSVAQVHQEAESVNITVGEATVQITLADTPEKRRRGLSGRENLTESEGMLFVFESENVRPPFWMKDMLIPIDIIWINDDVVTGVEANVQPEPGVPDSQLSYFLPDNDIDHVLEVPSGFAERHNITEGTTVDLSGIAR